MHLLSLGWSLPNLQQTFAAKPGYVESWLIIQMKAEFKSIDIHFICVDIYSVSNTTDQLLNILCDTSTIVDLQVQ